MDWLNNVGAPLVVGGITVLAGWLLSKLPSVRQRLSERPWAVAIIAAIVTSLITSWLVLTFGLNAFPRMTQQVRPRHLFDLTQGQPAIFDLEEIKKGAWMSVVEVGDLAKSECVLKIEPRGVTMAFDDGQQIDDHHHPLTLAQGGSVDLLVTDPPTGKTYRLHLREAMRPTSPELPRCIGTLERTN